MPRQFFAPWDQTMPIPQTHHPQSHNGNSTSPIEIPEDHPKEMEEGDPHRAIRDCPQEVEAVEAVEVETVEAGEGEHFPYQDTHLPNLPRNF